MQLKTLSIIIPAHNEQRLIISTLDNLLADGKINNCNIVVVANGCVDNTVNVVNTFIQEQLPLLLSKNNRLQVIDETLASKTNAINIGLNSVPNGIKVLLDADIKISGQYLLNLVDSLNSSVILASPKLNYDTSASSTIVKWYYQIASRSPYNQRHRISNVIALSEEAQIKLGQLPHIIADDEFVRRQFHCSEYRVVENANFTFTCPRDAKNLLNVLTRVERGNLQLKRQLITDNSEAKSLSVSFEFSHQYFTFLFFKIFAKYRAKWQFSKGKVNQWERDESNR